MAAQQRLCTRADAFHHEIYRAVSKVTYPVVVRTWYLNGTMTIIASRRLGGRMASILQREMNASAPLGAASTDYPNLRREQR